MKFLVFLVSIRIISSFTLIPVSYYDWLAEPHISVIDVKEYGDCPMLILACDGLWDMLSDQDALDLLMERFLADGPYETAAAALTDAAINLGSRDNVTVIVVFL